MSTFRRRLMMQSEKGIKPYMHIEALEDNLTVSLSTNAIEYSLDGSTWVTLPANTASPAINTGEKIYFKGELTPTSSVGIGTFTLSKRCNAGGNAMSLLFGDDFQDQYSLSGKNYAFAALFESCETLISVSDNFLPATTLADYCYRFMFRDCASLTTAPKLPAITLTNHCYEGMFYRCASLTTTPELPATTLADYCYNSMFNECTSLKSAPSELPATSLAPYCYRYMFYHCHSLESAPELPATTLASYCYYYMFFNCKSLKSAPSELPAKVVWSYSCAGMFRSCTSLEIAPELPGTYVSSNCYSYMFYGCTSLKSAPSKLPETRLYLNSHCYSYMFYGCTSLKSAPELPAIDLYSGCYNFMFYNCSSLNYIKALFTTTPGSSYTDSWVYNVASSGIFVKNKDATWDVTGTSGIPSGWTVVNDGDATRLYTIDLNSNWQQSTTISNPDSSLYDGVYESYSNKGVDSTAAIMYIDIVGYTDFSLYIRSYAESNYDYVMVSQLDQTIDNNTSYSNTTLVKAHTRGSQTSGTAIGNYKLVEFTGIDGGVHRITVLYRKDSSSDSGDDKGYLLIPKNQ